MTEPSSGSHAISDRTRADQAESFLAAIVKSSDDAIYSRDLEGKILSWNTGAESLYGYEAAEIIGQPIQLITPPDKLAAERGIVERICFYERVEHFETVRLTKDGRRVDISLTMSPIHDSSGRIVGISKIARDITSQKEAEDFIVALKDTLASQLADLSRLHEMSVRLSKTLELEPTLQETLRTAVALEGTDMGLLSICDEQGALHVGASLGFSDEFLSSIEAVQPGCAACGTCLQQRQRIVVEDVETEELFEPYRHLARQAGFRAVHSTPLITRSGKIVGVLSTHFRHMHRPSDQEIDLIDLCARQAVDFIENSQLYTQLREADRRKDEFLATLAHELRNPLAPISNALHILRLSGELPPAAERVREIMERQVNHLIRLVEDLLEVSRVTRGKIELRKEPVELASVIESAVDTIRPLIEAAGHQLAIAISPHVIPLQADPVRLAQIISNLLNNAAKYTDPGGQIWLTAQREGGEVMISVRDNGMGIPAEMLPRVFDMFAQVDKSLKRSQGGLGIGLTLAKNLVQMHGGQIEVRSEGLGKGSEFIIRLPLKIESESIASAPIAPLSNKPLPVRRILVVDDTHAAVFILGRLLEALGQQVFTAPNAAAGLEIAMAERPDVIISDIAMPGMDGYELAGRLRKEPGLEKVVLVALTGYGQDRDRQQARESGFNYHLVKPVSIDALQSLLASLPGMPKDALSYGNA
jgi:PAS domain S-box-containing protein